METLRLVSWRMVKELITAATPRLFKHYKVRVIWAVDEGMLNRRPSHGQCNLDLKACGPRLRWTYSSS